MKAFWEISVFVYMWSVSVLRSLNVFLCTEWKRTTANLLKNRPQIIPTSHLLKVFPFVVLSFCYNVQNISFCIFCSLYVVKNFLFSSESFITLIGIFQQHQPQTELSKPMAKKSHCDLEGKLKVKQFIC